MALGYGAELVAGAGVAVGGVEHDGVARGDAVGSLVEDTGEGVGVVEVAVAAEGVAGVEVGKVDAFVAAGAELEPCGVDAADGVVGDEGLVAGVGYEVVEVDAFGVGGDGVEVLAVGSVPECPLVGRAVVVPLDAACGVGDEVGTYVAYGVEEEAEFKPRGGEGVAVAVEFDADVACCGVDFDVVVVAAPVGVVPLPRAFVVDGEVVEVAYVCIAAQGYGSPVEDWMWIRWLLL